MSSSLCFFTEVKAELDLCVLPFSESWPSVYSCLHLGLQMVFWRPNMLWISSLSSSEWLAVLGTSLEGSSGIGERVLRLMGRIVMEGFGWM